MHPRLPDFAKLVSTMGLREVDEAIAFVWFLTHVDQQEDGVTPAAVAAHLERFRLRSNVNVSRLNKNLTAHDATVRGVATGTFRIKASNDDAFNERYSDFFKPCSPTIRDDLIPDDLSFGARRYLNDIRQEANASYQFGLYNSAAVMCRRLTEMLLVDAFEKAGQLNAILDGNGNVKMLGDIITAAKSKSYIRLSRTSPGHPDKIKEAGDAAAHHRFYITRKADLDTLNPGLRHLLTELATLAGH